MTGKGITFPGLRTGDMATDSLYDDEAVRRIMERDYEGMKKFRETEFLRKLDTSRKLRLKGYENIPRCNIQLWKSGEDKDDSGKVIDTNTETDKDKGKVIDTNMERGKDKGTRKNTGGDENAFKVNFEEEDFGEDIEEKEVEEIERRRMRSMTAVERRELKRDQTSTFVLRMENTDCYKDCAVYAVEVPTVEHKKVKVIEAKEKELVNLIKYVVY